MGISIKLERSELIKWGITIITPLLILLIPTGDTYTRTMSITIALTACFLIWAAFELTNLLVPSLLWPVALMISGAVSYDVVYAAYIGSDVFAVIALMTLATTLERVGLLKRIAFMVASKFKGTFTSTCFAVFFATFVVALATFACGDAIMAALTFGAVKAFKLLRTRAGAVVMMAGMLGGITMRMVIYYPFFVGAMTRSAQSVAPDFQITQMDLLLYNWPILIFGVLFLLFLTKFYVKKDDPLVLSLNSKTYYREELEKLGKISKEEKIGIIALLGCMVMILTYSWHGIDYNFSFIIALSILFVLKIAESDDIKDAPMGMILFFAACMTIGSVCAATGITALVGDMISSAFANLSKSICLFGILGVGFLLNFCMTPMAMCAGFTGLIYEVAQGLGIAPMVGVMTFYFSTDMVLFPYEFLSFLFFYAYGAIKMADFVKLHALKCVAFAIFFGVVFIPYWRLLGLS